MSRDVIALRLGLLLSGVADMCLLPPDRSSAQQRHEITAAGTRFFVNGSPYHRQVFEFIAMRER